MKITILGNNGPYPEKNGACSGYLLEHEKTKVLIDCGCGVLPKLLSSTDVADLSAIILSHLHFDHMSDVLVLQYYLQFHPADVPIRLYAPRSPENILSLINSPSLQICPISDLGSVGQVHFSTMPVRHPVESYAVKAQADGASFVYTGDTNTVPALAAFCEHADLLLADAGLAEEAYHENAPHLSPRLCGCLAAKAHVKQLLLTHLNPLYSQDVLLQEAEQEFSNSAIAKIGSVWQVS